MALLRDLWFYLTFGLLTAAVTPTSLVTVLLTGSGDLGQRIHARRWARAILWANRLRLEVAGLERVARGTAYVLMANHPRPEALLALPATLPGGWRITMKASLARIPLFAFMARLGGQVFLDLRDTERAIRSLERARPLLARGLSVIVFPEGTRSGAGPLRPLKRGGFHLAVAAGAPILPVRIDLRGRRVRIAYGAPVPTAGLGADDIPGLVDRVAPALREPEGTA
jgi:1-acyl-sn-glycerol-3-phosphate acyltransferase